MKLRVFIEDGRVSFIYHDDLRPFLDALAGVEPQRASRVEMVPGRPGDWYVDFTLLAQQLQRPELAICLAQVFPTRVAALEAEVAFLMALMEDDGNGDDERCLGADP